MKPHEGQGDQRGRRALLRLVKAVGLAALLVAAVSWLVFKTDVFLSSLPVGPLGPQSQAEALLQEMQAFHGDPERWAQQAQLQLEAEGDIPFVPARLAFGLARSKVRLTLRYEPGSHGTYEYKLEQGDEVTVGRADTNGARDGLGLLLDSVRHLFELPQTANSIPFQRGLPSSPSGQRRAFFTWGSSAQASADHDQIVLWSDRGRLARMDTTGRDIAPFTVARVEFEGLTKLGAFQVPTQATIYGGAQKTKIIHRWKLRSIGLVQPRTAPLVSSSR